ncbi:MAG: DNA gyrase inhibitor YacG [Cystobacterineae bacterium]|nr:DNA gyrase inhibitor YacG [Cystobacterineae bacterium]
MSPKTPSCVQCGQPLGFSSEALKEPPSPFCSQRCKEVDLYRWLDEDYRIPACSENAAVPEEIVEGNIFKG